VTPRARINRQTRTALGITLVGMAIFLLGMLGKGAGPVMITIGLCGFVLAWLTMAGTYLIGIRCPRCGGRLTYLAMSRGIFGLHPRLRFCPYCGISLDDNNATPS